MNIQNAIARLKQITLYRAYHSLDDKDNESINHAITILEKIQGRAKAKLDRMIEKLEGMTGQE